MRSAGIDGTGIILIFRPGGGRFALHLVADDFRKTQDGIERRPQFMAHIRQELTLRLAGRFDGSFRLRHLGFDGEPFGYVTGYAVDQAPFLARTPLKVSVAAVAATVTIDNAPDVLLDLDPLHLRAGGEHIIRMDERDH